MPPAGFEPTIPASERPQTHALDCAATGTGIQNKRQLYPIKLANVSIHVSTASSVLTRNILQNMLEHLCKQCFGEILTDKR